ncbi:MAG: hypothetical protein A2096_12895 [Spirochaetes bacterium GWF1_41_5]|nr:MAG: hypothetical protein A2096_12895 [Spirochaetes bacterium GWF1_41_5]HBE02181.1 hypothetical protein [Spirochaetia bacterium]
MKKNTILSVNIYFYIIAILVSAVFTIFQIAFLDVEFLLLHINKAPGIELVNTSRFLLANMYWMFAVNALLSLPLMFILVRFYEDCAEKEKKPLFSFDYLIFLLLAALYCYCILAMPYVYKIFLNKQFAGLIIFNETVFSRVISNVIAGNAAGKIIFFVFIIAFAFRSVWILFYDLFLLVFFQTRLSRIYELRRFIPAVSRSEIFINTFQTQIANMKRFRQAIGLLGFKAANEIELLDQIGYQGFKKVISRLAFLVESSARKGENQLLHHSNVILSVLIANEEQAKLAAERFFAVLQKAEIIYNGKKIEIKLACGAAGYDFSTATWLKTPVETLFNDIMWKVMDQTGISGESGKIEILYLK